MCVWSINLINALLLSTVIMLGGAGPPATANVLDETFNNATNYDNTHWVETTVSAGVIDPNETTLCLSGTGFSGQCLESTAGGTNRKGYTENDLTVPYQDLVKVVIYFGLHNMGAPADGSTQIFVEGRTTAATSPSLGVASFGAQLYYDVDGTGDGIPRTTCSVAPCWRLDMRIGGTDNVTAGGRPEILPDTIYRMEFTVDAGTSAGEAKLGTTTILSNVDSTYTLQFVRLGISEFSVTTETIVMDWAKLSTGGYVEAP